MEACLSTNEDECRVRLPATHGSNLGFDTKSIDDWTALNSLGDGDGCPRACANILSRKGSSQCDVGEDRMELKVGSGIRPQYNECLTPNHELTMNIIAWNCRGALKPNFQSHVHDLVWIHDPCDFCGHRD